MSLSDTIAALASPPGRSPRAIIRVSGPATFDLLNSAVTSPPTSSACRVRLRLTDTLELPCLLLAFHAPHSYTGEDAAEIQIPGNPALADRVLARLLSHPGTRPANPGEFTARACLNNRLSVEQGEGVGALIAAQSADELAAARDLAAGRTGRLHHRWTDEATTLLALVEAGIDFTDQEDVVAIEPRALESRLAALTEAIRAHLGASTGAESPDHTPIAVLAGPPNAGKSTLFNALLNRRRAVESPIAGTTRDALREPLDLSRDLPGAGPITLVDLAGLEDTVPTSAMSTAAQSTARTEIARADLIIHCDPTGRFAPLAPTDAAERRILRVRTKADLPTSDISQSRRRDPHLEESPRRPTSDIPVCALDGWNLRTLRRAIADAAWAARPGATALVPARHRRALSAALASLDAACTLAPDSRRAPELIAGRLRESIDAFSELVGRISPDDILGRVFATFCVGK